MLHNCCSLPGQWFSGCFRCFWPPVIFVKDRNSNLTCIKLAPNHKPVAFAMDDIDRYYDKEISVKLSKFISEDVSKFIEKIGEISDKLSLGVNL